MASVKHLELWLICPTWMELLEILSAGTTFKGIQRCYGVKERNGWMQHEREESGQAAVY